jgi:hypothetical protein
MVSDPSAFLANCFVDGGQVMPEPDSGRCSAHSNVQRRVPDDVFGRDPLGSGRLATMVSAWR